MSLEELCGPFVPAVGVPSVDATVVVAVVVTLILVATVVFVTVLAFGPNVSSRFGDPSDHAIGAGVDRSDRPVEADRDDASDRDATDVTDRE